MGNTESLWQKIRSAFYGNTDVKILMIGLDAAGKTSILYKLKLGEVVTTIPTIGFNVETVAYKGINFTTWDVGSRIGTRALIRYYFEGTDVVVLVVDSNDQERMDECRDELHKLMCEDELKDCCLLVMANKQDLPNALSLEEVRERLELNKLPPTRAWHIEGTCATNGDGLYEGLTWLQSQLTTKQLKKSVSQPTTEVKDSLTGKNGFLTSCFSLISNYFTSKETPHVTESQ